MMVIQFLIRKIFISDECIRFRPVATSAYLFDKVTIQNTSRSLKLNPKKSLYPKNPGGYEPLLKETSHITKLVHIEHSV